MIIVFLGPPGSGKGTQAQMLDDEHGFYHFDTGSLLRAEVASGKVAGTFPTLLPGANRVMLASQAKPAANFRVIVKTVKVYR